MVDNVTNITFGKATNNDNKSGTEVAKVISNNIFADKQKERRILNGLKNTLTVDEIKWPKTEGVFLTDFDVKILQLLGYESLLNIFLTDNWVHLVGFQLMSAGYQIEPTINNLLATMQNSSLGIGLTFATDGKGQIVKCGPKYTVTKGDTVILDTITESMDALYLLTTITGVFDTAYMLGKTDEAKK